MNIKNKYCVYGIFNKLNWKMYIGQTINITRRMAQHRYELNNNTHSNSHLQESWNKYGEENFEFGILDATAQNIDDLNELEPKYIEEYKTLNKKFGYNLTAGGKNGTRRQESIEKQRIKMIGKYIGEKHPMYGKHHTKETKNKQSIAKKGIYFGKNHPRYGSSNYNIWLKKYGKKEADKKQKILNEKHSILMRDEKHPAYIKRRDTNPYPKLLSPDGIIYEIEGTLKNFAKEHSLQRRNLCSVVNNKRKTCKGWTIYIENKNV